MWGKNLTTVFICFTMDKHKILWLKKRSALFRALIY